MSVNFAWSSAIVGCRGPKVAPKGASCKQPKSRDPLQQALFLTANRQPPANKADDFRSIPQTLLDSTCQQIPKCSPKVSETPGTSNKTKIKPQVLGRWIVRDSPGNTSECPGALCLGNLQNLDPPKARRYTESGVLNDRCFRPPGHRNATTSARLLKTTMATKWRPETKPRSSDANSRAPSAGMRHASRPRDREYYMLFERHADASSRWPPDPHPGTAHEACKKKTPTCDGPMLPVSSKFR